MDHNILAYWRRLQNEPDARPSPRVCRLMSAVFEGWRGKQPWPAWDAFGHLFDRYEGAERERVQALTVIERKGLAIQQALAMLHELPEGAGAARIHPDELIVGTSPPYSVGQGKELMRYLTADEALRFELVFFNEWSPFGHICPNYQLLLRHGIGGVVQQARAHLSSCPAERQPFYRAAIDALEGVSAFALAYADKADARHAQYAATAASLRSRLDDPARNATDFERRNPETQAMRLAGARASGMAEVAQRLRNIATQPPASLAEACQLFYLMHIALHWTGDITSIGRLDQLLWPFYERDLQSGALDAAGAQELIDCLWLKLDERVVLDRGQVEDRFTDADGALLGTGAASNFDQGALINQWMQQVTLSGFVANDDDEPTDGTNDLTYMMLAASRRMPLNSPTLDLRVHRDTPTELLEAAAHTLLSGGAHPVLMNDDRIVPELHQRSGGTVRLADARNYACDGCFETHFPGQTDFSFGFVPALDVLEKALNGGAGFGAAGSVYLRGSKQSIRTPPAGRIGSWDELWDILVRHIDLSTHRFLAGILRAYGSKEPVSPSPLLSALIEGCMASGRDFAGAGPRYHVFAPLMTGISTAADSLYAIRSLVFEKKAFTLEELVACLRSDWGHRPGVVGLKLSAERTREIWDLCRSQPKFGTGNAAVDQHAWDLVEAFCDAVDRVRGHPLHEPAWAALRARYDTPDQPFELLFTPGVGTFEQYVFGGQFAGATPDGRRAGAPIASDLSPSPLNPDVTEAPVELRDALHSYAPEVIDRLSDGAPADFNVAEDFPADALVEVLRAFANGSGGNMMTVTVASPDTFAGVADDPDGHDLVRVRMGGWTEYLRVLSPEHIAQHRSRRVYVARATGDAP